MSDNEFEPEFECFERETVDNSLGIVSSLDYCSMEKKSYKT